MKGLYDKKAVAGLVQKQEPVDQPPSPGFKEYKNNAIFGISEQLKDELEKDPASSTTQEGSVQADYYALVEESSEDGACRQSWRGGRPEGK